MKIADIRDVIRTAAWVRRDLTGGTSEEFKRQDVGGRLAEHIAKLKALVIAERFAAERLARDEEIGYCEDTIARWNKARGSVATPTRPGTVYVATVVEQHEPEEPRMYTRLGGPILKVIDGGKKS